MIKHLILPLILMFLSMPANMQAETTTITTTPTSADKVYYNDDKSVCCWSETTSNGLNIYIQFTNGHKKYTEMSAKVSVQYAGSDTYNDIYFDNNNYYYKVEFKTAVSFPSLKSVELTYSNLEEFSLNSLRYKVFNADQAILVKKLDESQTVNVPTQVSMDGLTFDVTEIADECFYKDLSSEEITIPATITKIGDRALFGCTNLKTLTSEASIPPTINDNNCFGGIDKNLCTLRVPKESISKYSTEKGWKDFYNVETLEGKPVSNIDKYGDFNGDGKIDIDDVEILLDYILSEQN